MQRRVRLNCRPDVPIGRASIAVPYVSEPTASSENARSHDPDLDEALWLTVIVREGLIDIAGTLGDLETEIRRLRG